MGNCVIFCCFLCVFFVPFVLQGVGFFTPNWASNENCTKLGLFHRCCGNGTEECITDNADTYINTSALALQGTSFAILLLTVLSLGCTLCSMGDDGDGDGGTVCLCCAVCSTLMYPVSGVLIIVGCILVAIDYPTSSLGYSFYLAVTAGCLIILQLIIMCYLGCKQGGSYDGGYGSGYDSRPGSGYDARRGSSPEMAVSTTRSSGQPMSSGGGYVAGQVISHEVAGVSGGMAFVRRIQIVRIMRMSHIIE